MSYLDAAVSYRLAARELDRLIGQDLFEAAELRGVAWLTKEVAPLPVTSAWEKKEEAAAVLQDSFYAGAHPLR